MYVDNFEALDAIADSMRTPPSERKITGAARARMRQAMRINLSRGAQSRDYRRAKVSLAYLSCLENGQ